jgi:radical SAM-linked protein
VTRAARQPPNRDTAPAVQKLRVRYAKRGRLRFASHRDFQRALERALRRAEVPMAYSAGFTPHPKVSYLGAAATGTASEAEYLELSLARAVDPDKLRVAVDSALSPGLDVVEVVEAGGGSLADRLQASAWQIELRGVESARAAGAVATFLAAEEVEVSRRTKSGMRVFDARGPVVQISVSGPALHSGFTGPCAILRLVVRHTTPAVRPDDVLAALHAVAGLTPPTPPLATRLAQGPLLEDRATADGGSTESDVTDVIGDPLAADRTPGAPAVGS